MAGLSGSLRKKLRTYSPEALNRIAEAWAVELPENMLEDPAFLGEQLLDTIAARSAWENISPSAREILHQMFTFEIADGVPSEDLQKIARLTDAEYAHALRELEERLMLIEDKPDARVRVRLEARQQVVTHVLLVPKEFREMFNAIDGEIHLARGDRSKLQLLEILQGYNLQQLTTIAKQLDDVYHSSYSYHYYPAHSPTLAKTITGKLMQVRLIEQIWEKLDSTNRQICRWLCRNEGSAEISQLRSALDLSRLALDHHLRQLEGYGLVFDTFGGQERKVFIGRGLFKVLRKVIGEIDEVEAQAQESSEQTVLAEAPPVVREAVDTLLYDLAIVVGAVYQQVIEPTQAGYVPKRIANKIFPLLHGSRPASYDEEDRYLDMIFDTASGLGLLETTAPAGQKQRYVAGPDLEAWGQLGPVQQIRRVLDLWWSSNNNSWIDVAGANYQPDGFGYYIDMRSARKGLLDYLKRECQPGKWYVLEPFLQNAKARDPLLLRSQSPYAAYSVTRNRKEILQRWDRTDGQIIAGILASTLHELGLITLGFQPVYSANEEFGNPYAFQLTERAGKVLWLAEEEATCDLEKSGGSLIVQPNFELLLLQPDYQTLYQLLPFTKVEQVEMVSRLILTRDTVRRGIEAGWNVERILQTLQRLSTKELPQNILYTLQDWERVFKDATVSQVLLLELGNEALTDELCHSSKLSNLGLRRLGPCAVAVESQVSLQVLRSTLEKEGMIVRVQGNILTAKDTLTTSYYDRRR